MLGYTLSLVSASSIRSALSILATLLARTELVLTKPRLRLSKSGRSRAPLEISACLLAL
jgi:hypothetical protein